MVRRRGVGTALVGSLEDAAREHGMTRIGMSAATGDDAGPGELMYEGLGYRRAHGPLIMSTNLWADDGSPIPVGAVMTYLVKELAATRS